MRGRTRMEDGGERLQIPLMHAQNSTADILSGHGLIDTTPQEGITSAFYPWAQLAVSISISHLEERQNSGRHRILNLLQSKNMQAEVSLKELLNNCLVGGRITCSSASGSFTARVGRLDTNASGPLPLAALIDLTATRSRTDIGGINPKTYTWWGNQSVNATGISTFIAYKKALNQGIGAAQFRRGRPRCAFGAAH